VEGVPEKAIFRSATVYNKNLSSQCNLLAQIEQAILMQFLKIEYIIYSAQNWEKAR
jgi:hypothetical protein